MLPLSIMSIRIVLNAEVSSGDSDRFLPPAWCYNNNDLKVFSYNGFLVQSSTNPQSNTIESRFTEKNSLERDNYSLDSCNVICHHHRPRATFKSHPLGRGTFYYIRQDDQLFLSTSLVDICVLLPHISLCQQMVAEYLLLLRCSSTQQNLTFINGILQLPAGHCLDWENGEFSIYPYWLPIDEPDFESLSVDVAATKVNDALQQVIMSQNLPEQVGCLVSGGLDSSVVAAAVKHHQDKKNAHTVLVTLGSNLDSPEERKLQSILAKHLKLSLTHLSLPDPRLQLNRLRDINRWSNVPSGGIFTGIYHDAIEQCKERDIHFLIGGEGGDEIFNSDSLILADYFTQRKWRSLIEGIGFFSSIFFEVDSLSTFVDSAIMPKLSTSRIGPWVSKALGMIFRNTSDQRTERFLSDFIGEFSRSILQAQVAHNQDLKLRCQSGFSFASYLNYRQAIELPNYEIRGAYQDTGIFNPLGSIEVFKAAMTLQLKFRTGAWIGFRPKYLLSTAATLSIPKAIALHPKIGRSTLLAHVTQGVELEAMELLGSPTFEDIGIRIPQYLRDPRNVPVSVSLYWSWLLRLSIWIEELKEYVANYSKFQNLNK